MRSLAADDMRGLLLRAMPGLTLLQPGGNLLEILVGVRCRLCRRASRHLAEVLRCPVAGAVSAGRWPEVLTGRLRAVHVIAGLDPVYGGPSYSVPRLCEALAAAGAETMLLSVAKKRAAKAMRATGAIAIAASPGTMHASRSCAACAVHRACRDALREAALTADVIHNHGLWLMPNVRAGEAAAGGRTPLVISPRGMLAPAALAFSRLKKRAFWRCFRDRRSAVQPAFTRRANRNTKRSAVSALPIRSRSSPTGSTCPNCPREPTAGPAAERVVLSLGRIHPKKGLARLVHAWSKVEAECPGWRLKIVGPPEAGHDDELRALAMALGLTRVSIEGPIYGDAKTAAYRDADLFVLPTLNENFGLTVAEALAAGTPAISTKGAPWSGLDERRLRLVDRSWGRAPRCGLGACDGIAARGVEGDG